MEWGCGFRDEYRGRACGGIFARSRAEWLEPATDEQRRTCPQWFARQPYVRSVLEHLADYRRGALGDVRDLPAPALDALRDADGAQQMWENEQLEKLND